jgi:hypothetical protein
MERCYLIAKSVCVCQGLDLRVRVRVRVRVSGVEWVRNKTECSSTLTKTKNN